MSITVANTVARAAAARRTGNSFGRRIQQATYKISSDGINKTAENFVINARPIAAEAATSRGGVASSRYSTQRTQAKKKNTVTGKSVVTYRPCAIRFGSKAQRAAAVSPAA